MYRGTRKYKCPNCGEIFTAPDIEWNAIIASAPQRCPRCGRVCFPYSLGLIDSIINLFKSKK